ncbi:hypothetical protein AB0A74_09760 [Saccharothrix sp. NPDC042600]|uniref:hypothetical protein n=1 Tax=Saccharothrix TaxID=2071 RepID=UPI0033C4CC4A|nr:hypothetical protein GCM10017745_35920 [Saccharothrix mutabilis subsp. capreolus]
MNITFRALIGAVLGVALLAPAAQLAVATPATANVSQAAQGAAVSTRETGNAHIPLRLTASERQEWTALVSTEEGRLHVLTQLQDAFGGALTVGTSPGTPNKGGDLTANLSTGITGDHFWIIVSYADVVNGAVAAGVAACATRLPGWLCSAAGNLIKQWAAGWGNASNHGIWAEIYWMPPQIKVGRW